MNPPKVEPHPKTGVLEVIEAKNPHESPDPSYCPACGAHYTREHHQSCAIVAARKAAYERGETEQRRLYDASFEGRVANLGLMPPFKARETACAFIVEDRAAVTVCECDVVERAVLIADALNFARYYDDED